MRLDGWQACARELLGWSADRTPLSGDARARLRREAAEHLDILRSKQIDSLYYLAVDPDHPIQRVYDKTWRAQREAATQLVQALARADVRPVLFKGVELLNSAFDGRGLGFLNDVDVLVERRALERVNQILYAGGYRHANVRDGRLVDLDIDETECKRGMMHYELAPFAKLAPLELDAEERAAAREIEAWPLVGGEQGFSVVLEIDVHFSVALDVAPDGLFERVVPSAIAGAYSLEAADHLWLVTCRHYNEVAVHGKRTLRDLVYIATLLARGGIRWNLVLEAAAKYEIRPALYYVWSYLAAVAGRTLAPHGVLAACDPRMGSRSRDWGWQLPKLFDEIDPLPIETPE